MDERSLLTPAQAAEYLELRVEQVRQLIRLRDLPAHNVSVNRGRPTRRIRPDRSMRGSRSGVTRHPRDRAASTTSGTARSN